MTVTNKKAVMLTIVTHRNKKDSCTIWCQHFVLNLLLLSFSSEKGCGSIECRFSVIKNSICVWSEVALVWIRRGTSLLVALSVLLCCLWLNDNMLQLIDWRCLCLVQHWLLLQIYVEVERARLSRILAEIFEGQGKVSEAATVLQELQVSLFLRTCY